MKAAILGDGLLGRTIADLRPDWTLLSHRDIEVTDRASVKQLAGYDVAVNTVAFHRLPECESSPTLAEGINHYGPRNVGEVVRQVFISTDYVHEDGPVAEVMPGSIPKSVYGQTKLRGELACCGQGGAVIRVAALYGHYRSHKGPTFPEMVLASRDPLKLPIDQRFSPTYAPDAATRIVEVAENPDRLGLYHATNSGSASWYEYALNIIELANINRKVTPRTAHDPLRPRNSVLKSTLLPPLRHWRNALEEWWSVEQQRRVAA
jgi:dTDP-4-dehydrorhamnose reductase